MEHEHPSTTAVARAGGATASSPAARSPLAAFQNDHEQWDVTDNSARPIPYGRFNGLFNFPSGSRSSSPARRGRVRVFLRASGTHSNPVMSPPGRNPPVCDGNLRVGAFHGSRPLFHTSRLDGWRRPAAQSLPNQHLSQSLADRLKAHPYRLSFGSTDLEISCEPKGLGNVRKAFGELRNV